MTGRQSGFQQNLRKQRGAEWRCLRRFHHHCVAGRDRGPDFVRDEIERRVEGGDCADHTARHTDGERHAMRVAGRAFDGHHLADKTLPFFSRNQDGLNRARHFGLRVGNREPGFCGNHPRKLVAAMLDEIAGAAQQQEPVVGIEPRCLERLLGSADGGLDLLA
jgi:hypothetical protein